MEQDDASERPFIRWRTTRHLHRNETVNVGTGGSRGNETPVDLRHPQNQGRHNEEQAHSSQPGPRESVHPDHMDQQERGENDEDQREADSQHWGTASPHPHYATAWRAV
jgi:hypothetical protein